MKSSRLGYADAFLFGHRAKRVSCVLLLAYNTSLTLCVGVRPVVLWCMAHDFAFLSEF